MLKTHQKVLARVLAKDYLKHLRPHAFRALADQGVFRPPSDAEVQGHVLPWLYDMAGAMMLEDNDADVVLRGWLETACDTVLRAHGSAIQGENKRKERKQKEEEERQEALRVERERLQREQEEHKREEAVRLLLDKVTKQIVEKGEWRNEIAKQVASNVHGYFQSRPTVGLLGGLLGEMGIALSAAVNAMGNKDWLTPKAIYIFFVTYVAQHMKSEQYLLYLPPNLASIATAKGVKLEELQTLDEEGTNKFMEEYKAADGGGPLYSLVQKESAETGVVPEIFTHLRDGVLRLILRKPREKERPGTSASHLLGKQVAAKQKLQIVSLPESFKHDPLKPHAIVRIRIPLLHPKPADEEPEDKDEEGKKEGKAEGKPSSKGPDKSEAKEGDEEAKAAEDSAAAGAEAAVADVTREIEYEDKVLAVKPVLDDLYVYVLHQAASREVRRELCEALKTHFEKELETVEVDALTQQAEQIAARVQTSFLNQFPDVRVFDFEKN